MTEAENEFARTWTIAAATLEMFKASEWVGDGSGLIGNGICVMYGGEDERRDSPAGVTPTWLLVLKSWPGKDERSQTPILGRITRTQAGLAADVEANLEELRMTATSKLKLKAIPALLTDLRTADKYTSDLDQATFAVLYGWSTPLFGAASTEFDRVGRESGNRYASSIDDAVATISRQHRLKACGIAEDGSAYAEVGGPLRPDGTTYCTRRATAKTIPLAICIASFEMRMLDGSSPYD